MDGTQQRHAANLVIGVRFFLHLWLSDVAYVLRRIFLEPSVEHNETEKRADCGKSAINRGCWRV
jgi:hypothetical protein